MGESQSSILKRGISEYLRLQLTMPMRYRLMEYGIPHGISSYHSKVLWEDTKSYYKMGGGKMMCKIGFKNLTRSTDAYGAKLVVSVSHLFSGVPL